jgi:hypothetical protein
MAPWIRIWIRAEIKSWIPIRIETNADPQHRFFPENFNRLSKILKIMTPPENDEKDKTI